MRYFLLALSAIIVFASCSKLDSTTTKQDWLRSGQWRFSSGNMKFKIPYTNPRRDTTSNLDSAYTKTCYGDNRLVFGVNYDGNVTTGGNKCIPGEADQVPFHWELINNDDSMLIYNAGSFFAVSEFNEGAGNSVNATITSFSQNSISLQYHDVYQYNDPNNKFNIIRDTVTYTMTLTH